jgi:DNA-binding NarL/FixJ family response regulator
MASGGEPRLAMGVRSGVSQPIVESRRANEGGTTSLALVVDRVAYGELLARALDNETDLRCVAVAASAAEVIAAAKDDVPAVVIVEGSRDTLNAATLDELKGAWPDTHLVVLTDLADPASTVPLARSGAAALLARESPLDEILRSIRCVGDGMVLVSEATLEAARRRLRARQSKSAPFGMAITPRETEVLRLLSRGNGIAAIARALGISINTSRGHLKSVMTKLGAHSQLEVVVLASRAGLVDESD